LYLEQAAKTLAEKAEKLAKVAAVKTAFAISVVLVFKYVWRKNHFLNIITIRQRYCA
jgi:hypothetical protein